MRGAIMVMTGRQGRDRRRTAPADGPEGRGHERGRRPLVLAALVLALAVQGPARALAADAASTSGAAAAAAVQHMIVVDVQRCLQLSVAAQGIQKQLDAQRAIYQAQIAKEEDKLRVVEQDLTNRRPEMSQDAFTQQQRAFEQRVADVQHAVQERKGALDEAYNQAMGTVRSTLLQIVADIASEQKASIVLSKQQVVLVEKNLDFTDTVLARLNKKLPQVTVKIPPLDTVNISNDQPSILQKPGD